ncbi:hypothetical protein GFS31_34740 [Leptolyngbya sp. BL0902]|nr:hypothetical protein GFS31_34740 [Leptolyngbya sp. BL0902]
MILAKMAPRSCDLSHLAGETTSYTPNWPTAQSLKECSSLIQSQPD